MSGMTLPFTLVIAFCAMIPWLKNFNAGRLPIFVANFLAAQWLVYVTLPSTAGTLFGDVGFYAGVFVIGNAVVAFLSSDRGEMNKVALVSGLGALGIFVLITAFSSPMFSSNSYARLVGQVKERKWNDDFQPKDPKHFRVSSSENAEMLASRALGQATTLDANGQPSSIGSQFQVNNGVSSVQLTHKEIWTIVPIDWTGWGPQWSGAIPGVPGYIKVSAENPILPGRFEKLPSGKEFQYSPNGIFSRNLDRLVWNNHPDKIIADRHLEIDENDTPHYIVSLALPMIGWWGAKVVGVVIVDPVTGSGADKFIPLGQVPDWVDRVESMELVHNNIDYHGKYSGGFLNRGLYKNSVLAATESHFGYGSNGEPVFQTGITAHNPKQEKGKADSLVAVYYTNTRTGETTEYMLGGGATEQSAVDQCNLVGDVKNRQYHATTPQLYNIYNRLAYVAPLQNASHAFAGVCIIDTMNVQVVAWGPSPHEADLAFKQMIINGNTQLAIDSSHSYETVVGKVTRWGLQSVNGAISYVMQIEGVPQHLFTVPVTASSKVPVTKEGDRVQIDYNDTHQEVMPVVKFNNLSIPLQASANELEVRTRAQSAVEAVYQPSDGKQMDALLKKLSSQEQELLRRQLNKKN